MAQFQYLVVDRKGNRINGTIESDRRDMAIMELKNQGFYILQIKKSRTNALKREIEIGKIVKVEELVVFIRQLATLIKAGVTIIDALFVLTEQTENKKFRKILRQIEADVRNGETFSSALSNHPKIFPVLIINMVRAGEISGNLDETLNGVAIFLEKESNTRKKVKSALTYPTVVSIFAVLVTIFLLIKVVPGFVNLYADFGAELPLPTRIVIGISNFFIHQLYMLIGFVLLIVGSLYMVSKNLKWKYYLDYAKLKIPVFGKLMQKSALSRFSRTFSTLLASAVPILQALTMVSQVVNNEAIAKPIRDARDHLRQGNPLHEPLKKNPLFPPLLTHMMAIGEETGSIDEMLNKVADFYEADVETMTDQLKSLIEPLMIVFLTVIVGTIILAVIMPMFGIYNLIGS